MEKCHQIAACTRWMRELEYGTDNCTTSQSAIMVGMQQKQLQVVMKQLPHIGTTRCTRAIKGEYRHYHATAGYITQQSERTVRRRFAASLWLLTSSCCASLSSFICSWWSRYRIWSKVSSMTQRTLHALASRAPGCGSLPSLLAARQAVWMHSRQP